MQDGDVPSVRTYQEVILARFMLEDQQLIESLLLPTLRQFAKRCSSAEYTTSPWSLMQLSSLLSIHTHDLQR